VDEASQVRVPEASVPFSLVAPQGRVVLGGDHLQVPPIVRGVYSETAPGEAVLHRPELYADAFRLGLVPKAVAAVLLRKVIALRTLTGSEQRTTLKDRVRATAAALQGALTVPAQTLGRSCVSRPE
jgi:hypothetical protein